MNQREKQQDWLRQIIGMAIPAGELLFTPLFGASHCLIQATTLALSRSNKRDLYGQITTNDIS